MYMYSIAIPTYKRSSRMHTLNYLKKENVPLDLITVFVADKEEYDLYFAKYPEYKIVIGVLGICNQRNFITEYFHEGEYVISIDDDVRDIISLEGLPFMEWVLKCISYMEANKVELLGVNPTTNLFWAKERKGDYFKIGRYLCVGVFHIYVVRKQVKLTTNYGEDYQRSMEYLKKDGAVARYNGVCIQTTYWVKGGCSASGRTKETYCDQVKDLLELYPNDLYTTMKKITSLSKTELLPNIKIRNKKL
jgi:hypothetical protein